MKNHTIKTPTAELLIVEIPENGYYENYRDGIEVRDFITDEVLTLADYILLGKPDEIKEEDAEKLFYNPIDSTNLTHYANLRNLFSLIESEIYWENPWGKSPRYAFDENINPKDIKARGYHKLWHEAEQKTFDKNRSIIFKKNK